MLKGFDMLVLTRKIGERIKIGPDTWITVVDIDRGRVRLGLESPKDVLIMREELLAPEERHHGDWRHAD